ncbi:cobyric acid synthase [Corynebacterium pacaense]|uniref:cobyric acid synthase n=1 Tax=Corynebacterium pacaense TaxID=1816684 RepID=UPI0009BC5810|nr:cobyric acid synthase [Corynebacterium pacaense]
MSTGSALLIAGTTSDAGKSVITAGLCRAFARAGLRVAPFKAQNMSNNSMVTPDGGEIGRAQALQAFACGLAPSVEFNPILLKPGSDRRSQLVVMGQAVGDVGARDYVEHRLGLREVATTQLDALRERFDVVVCEGAGSPAEINLRSTDVANFGLAQASGMPVYIVGDIDRGGVLAHLFGTHAIVSAEDRALIRGFVINKFRGDPSILEPGLTELEKLTGVQTKAVIPYIDGLWIDAEDSLQAPVGRVLGSAPALGSQRLRVAAIRLPRISNSTDVEALAVEPGVTVTWVTDGDSIEDADLVVIPGSKATVSDLGWLRSRGLDTALRRRAGRNGPILGICGGFQMMARSIDDPVESRAAAPVAGLGLLDLDIRFEASKTLINHGDGSYEVHHGQVGRSAETPWIGNEGAHRGALWGTHRHGYLENDCSRREFLTAVAGAAGKDGFIVSGDASFDGKRRAQLDLIADTIESHWDLDQLLAEVSTPANVARSAANR